MTPITDTFEDRLLDALLDRFDATVDQPGAPSASLQRRNAIRRGTMAVGCVGAAVALIVVLEPGTSTPARQLGSAGNGAHSSSAAVAMAAWSSQPTLADQTQITTAENDCAANFGQAASSQPSSGKQGPTESGGPWSPELVDTRGGTTLALYSDTTQWMTCLESPTFVLISSISGTSATPVPGNSATLDYLRVRSDSSADGYTLAVGRVGTGVTGVGLQRVDGSVVTATIGDGHFIAWWPNGEGVSALTVTTSAGTQSDPVDPSFQQSNPQPSNKTVHQLPGTPGK
jgi:hypothetical protein